MNLDSIATEMAQKLVDSVNDQQCDCEKNDWSYYCDECVDKQAQQASENKFYERD